MEFKIHAVYAGDGQVELTHGLTGSRIMTDLPLDNGGKGRTFSPTDLAAAALASCVLTIMAKVAARDGITFDGTTFEIEKHMQESPRRIGRFTGWIKLPEGLSEKERAKLAACVQACPVGRSFHPDVKLDFKFL